MDEKAKPAVLTAAFVAAIIFVGLLWGSSRIAAWVRYSDVAESDRIAILQQHLTGAQFEKGWGIPGQVFAQLPDGTTTALRQEDIAEFGATACRRETECWSRRCLFTQVDFHCGFQVKLRSGQDATAYLKLSASTSVFGIASRQQFGTDTGRAEDTPKELCALGIGCASK